MPRTGRPRSVTLPMDEVRELASQGWTLRQLAQRYGCSRDLVMDRMKEAGIPRLPPYSHPGERNPAWKGGKYLDADGYVLVYVPNHPHATKAGRVREHRLVMELTLGRHLLPEEVVHHIDGDRANNDPSNLQVFDRNADHLRTTLKGKIPNWSPEGQERIRQGRRRSSEHRPVAILRGSETDDPSSP